MHCIKRLASWIVLYSAFITAVNANEIETITSQPVKTLLIESQHRIAPFAAEVEADLHASMAFPIAGQLKLITVRMGQSVGKGQLLAELDPTDYQLAVQAKEADLALVQIRATRNAKLFQQRLISEEQYDKSQTAVITAKAKLEQAQVDLDDTKLLAPFDGYVALTNAKVGQLFAANQTLMTIENNANLALSFNLPLAYASERDDLIDANIRFGNELNRYRATAVKEFSSQPDPDTNSYRVTLTVPKPKELNPLTGMNAWVELIHRHNTKTVKIPAGALFNRNGSKAQVWRITPDSHIEAVAIELAEDNTLLKGLNGGDRIVAASADQLVAGQAVRLWQRERGI